MSQDLSSAPGAAVAKPCDQLAVGSNRAVPEGSKSFPRTARLLQAEEFSVLFRMRPIKRSEHFVVYARPRIDPNAEPSLAVASARLPGRMGLVLGKKFAPRAATRNMLRRALRETFRLRREKYEGWDLLIRLNLRFDKQRFPGAAAPALKRACRAEVTALLDEAARHIARRRTGS